MHIWTHLGEFVGFLLHLLEALIQSRFLLGLHVHNHAFSRLDFGSARLNLGGSLLDLGVDLFKISLGSLDGLLGLHVPVDNKSVNERLVEAEHVWLCVRDARDTIATMQDIGQDKDDKYTCRVHLPTPV